MLPREDTVAHALTEAIRDEHNPPALTHVPRSDTERPLVGLCGRQAPDEQAPRRAGEGERPSCPVCAALTEAKRTGLTRAELQADRDRWVRLFNRLQGAVQHHRNADRFKEDHDEALYTAMDRVLRDAAGGGA